MIKCKTVYTIVLRVKFRIKCLLKNITCNFDYRFFCYSKFNYTIKSIDFHLFEKNSNLKIQNP